MTTITTTSINAANLSVALGSAIAALTSLDAEKLEKIEGDVSGLIAADGVSQLSATPVEMQEIIARHRLLGTLLASTSLNLNILERLHNRNSLGETSWVR